MMSGQYDAQLSHEYGRFVDYSGAATTEVFPNTSTEEWAQTVNTGNTGNIEAPHLGAIDFLGHYPGLPRPQFERWIRPPGLYVFYPFRDQISRSEIAMDYHSQQIILHGRELLPSEHPSTSQGTLEGFNPSTLSIAASPQPGIPSTDTVAYTHRQRSMPSEIALPPGAELHTSYLPTGTVPPHGSPQLIIDQPTPSTIAGPSDSDQQTEASDLNDEESQSCDSPESTYWYPPHASHNQILIPGVQTSIEMKHTSPTPTHHLGDAPGLRIIPYPIPRPNSRRSKRKSKTPCPKCPKGAFESRYEFAKHMTADHEKPVRFTCNHFVLHENGEQSCCTRSEWHISRWAKHHTSHHYQECTKKQSQDVPMPECRQEIMERPPVRQRGCWLCNHLSFTVEQWVDHHLDRHRGCSRRAMSQTWAMKSLLSHPDITFHWQLQIRNLEVNTGRFWNLKWPKDTKDPTMVQLMTCLETGLFRDKDFHKDSFVRAQVAEAAMNATVNTREEIAEIPAEQLLDLKAGLNHLRRDLAMAARAEMYLSPNSRQIQHAAASSALSLYNTRDLVSPYPDISLGRGNLYNHSGFDSGESCATYLNGEE